MKLKNRYAIVGIGSRSYLYSDALFGTFKDCARLAAICDINKRRMDYANHRFQESYGAETVPAYNPNELERMITNIIDNAIRYTHPEGKVEISLDKKDGSSTLLVQDTGIGIPEESLPLIFDRFYVVDKSRFKDTGGLGLGLSIVKQVADCHGGNIEVKSEVNKGTKFLIHFPPSFYRRR